MEGKIKKKGSRDPHKHLLSGMGGRYVGQAGVILSPLFRVTEDDYQ